MRNLVTALIVAAALAVSACTSAPAEYAREKLVDGIDTYCDQPQAVRAEIRTWVNENSPHEARVDCEGDQT